MSAETTDKSFSISLAIPRSPDVVFNCILEVPKWWTKDFQGTNSSLHDEFVIHHPGQHYSKQQVVESMPGKKIVWLVTDSRLNWLKGDQHDWNDTKIIFEIIERGEETEIHFTHEGLIPAKECYDRVSQGWTLVINENLLKYITEGKTI